MDKITRVFDLLDYYEQHYNQNVSVAGKVQGKWNSYSSKQFLQTVHDLSKGLLETGIRKGDRIGIMAGNCPQWNFVDFAAAQIGAALVPLYPTLSDHDLGFILKNSEVVLAFAGNSELQKKLMKGLNKASLHVNLFGFEEGDATSWTKLLDAGKKSDEDLAAYREAVHPDDLLTLIYTSGTTGNPKGVPLTHANLVSNFTACANLLPNGYKKALSFLPLSHIFERMVVYMYYFRGIAIYYAESIDTVVNDINEVKPHGFTTVPRVLEKVYDKIVEKGTALSGIKKALFFWSLKLGHRYQEPGSNGWLYHIQLSVARSLVFKKWKEALGGNIVAIISGGAALQERLARVFWASGIPVLEGYGLTETSPVIAVNSLEPGGLRFGTVGKVLKNVEVRIAEDGEIVCKGPSIFKQYYQNEEQTREAFDSEGYFKTGDIGQLSKDGFLQITDRKKEMFKTAGGKYVAPQALENKLMESTLIGQVMVIGEGRRFPAALVVPALEELRKWMGKKGIPNSGELADLVKEQAVIDKYQQIFDRANRGFGHWEQVKKFILLDKEWSIAEGELTPKLSLKRKVILETNKEKIEALYK